MCGMCLPHCPTYHLTRDESESPRGRIALIQGMVKERLPLTPRLENHLDHCLGCRACEGVCPSGVPYGQIIDGARAYIREHHSEPPAPTLLDRVAGDRGKLRLLGRALRLYQRSGLQRLARATGLTRAMGQDRLEALLPPLETQPDWREYYPAQGKARGEVALFIGCFADLTDRTTLNAAVHVMTRLGYGVHVPAAQTCCGALHLHQGDAATAHNLAQSNIEAFDTLQVDAIITTASGCGATLAEYPALGLASLKAPVRDISDFLDSISWPEEISLAPLPKTVAVHDPCSLTHVLHLARKPYHVLERIPAIKLQPLPDNRRCCGAAGSYMITQPEMADRLREEKIEALRSLNADILVTSNVGCALHLRAGLTAAGLNMEILHPVALIARQLQVASSK